MMKVKYSKEQEDEMRLAYVEAEDADERDAVVLKYSKKYNKTPRSVIAKLAKMGVYVSKVRASKVTGAKPETKEQLVSKLEARFGAEEGTFAGLEKAPKLVLVHLLNDNPTS